VPVTAHIARDPAEFTHTGPTIPECSWQGRARALIALAAADLTLRDQLIDDLPSRTRGHNP
jgi:hypothetical protein